MNLNFIFKADTHEYFLDGKKIENITSIIKPFMNCDFFDDYDRDRGSAVHKAIAMLCDGKAIGMCAGYGGKIMAWEKFRDENNYQPLIWEKPLYHPIEKWAGTEDQFGILNNIETVIEIKSGSDHPAYHLQTAAQAELIKVNQIGKPKQRILLQLNDDGTYKMHYHKDAMDIHIFKATLNIQRWRIKNNV